MKWRQFAPEAQKLKLYTYWRSSASWRVRWALAMKEIDFESQAVNLLTGENKSAEHLARNPMGLLPVLEVDNGIYLCESMAILEWIEEVYHLRGAPLFPGTPLERARVRQLCEIINSDTAPLQTPRAQKRHSADALSQKSWAQEFIRQGLQAFDQSSRALRKTFSIYNDVSAADLFLVPQIYNALRYEIDVAAEFPELHQIYMNCLNTEACKKSLPEAQPDAPKASTL